MFVQKYKALVVDDDPIARRAVGFALAQEDFDCAFACDGNDASRRTAGERFDLVVIDLRMPNKHGHALALELLARNSGAVLVVHTAIDDPRLAKDLIGRGVDDIVYKPANYPAFAAKMKAMVERRKESAGQPAPGTVSAGFISPIPPVEWPEYERRLTNVHGLFPLSAAAYEVYNLSSGEDATAAMLVGAVMQDAALMADVLRLANSPMYMRNNRPTSDLEEAVVRIGFKRAGEVALALNAMNATRSCALPWFDAELCRDRCLAASIALEQLCRSSELVAAKGMTMCGFLHPLGRLVLGSAFPDEYRALIQACSERRVALSALESRVFPETHTAALSRVLSRWNVPVEIWTPLRYLAESYQAIEELDRSIRDRVALIKLAVFVGKVVVGHWLPWDQIEPPPARLLADLHVPSLAPLIDETRAALGRVAKSLISPIGRPASARIGTEAAHGLEYCDLSGGQGDWMEALLASLEIPTVAPRDGDDRAPGGMLVNCLDASPSQAAEAARRTDSKGLKSLFLLAEGDSIDIGESSPAIRFPASVAALKARCADLATALVT
jgi:HD-like signal output (HDOD) protein/ActR/RegA family two-component response regulator